MDFISGKDRNQMILMPEIIDDYVDENNWVRVIEAYINSPDFLKMQISSTA